jgi:hypothetical protein
MEMKLERTTENNSITTRGCGATRRYVGVMKSIKQYNSRGISVGNIIIIIICGVGLSP